MPTKATHAALTQSRQDLLHDACPAGGGLRQLSPYDKWAAGCSTRRICRQSVGNVAVSHLHARQHNGIGTPLKPVAVHAKCHAGRGFQTQRDCWRRSTQYPGLAARHDAETHRRESARERQTAHTHSARCDSDPCRSALVPQGGSTPADTVHLLLPASRAGDHDPTTRPVNALQGVPHNPGSVRPHASPAVGTSVPPTWSAGFSLCHPE